MVEMMMIMVEEMMMIMVEEEMMMMMMILPLKDRRGRLQCPFSSQLPSMLLLQISQMSNL